MPQLRFPDTNSPNSGFNPISSLSGDRTNSFASPTTYSNPPYITNTGIPAGMSGLGANRTPGFTNPSYITGNGSPAGLGGNINRQPGTGTNTNITPTNTTQTGQNNSSPSTWTYRPYDPGGQTQQMNLPPGVTPGYNYYQPLTGGLPSTNPAQFMGNPSYIQQSNYNADVNQINWTNQQQFMNWLNGGMQGPQPQYATFNGDQFNTNWANSFTNGAWNPDVAQNLNQGVFGGSSGNPNNPFTAFIGNTGPSNAFTSQSSNQMAGGTSPNSPPYNPPSNNNTNNSNNNSNANSQQQGTFSGFQSLVNGSGSPQQNPLAATDPLGYTYWGNQQSQSNPLSALLSLSGLNGQSYSRNLYSGVNNNVLPQNSMALLQLLLSMGGLGSLGGSRNGQSL